MFESFAPFLVCMLIMPLVVKARVSYAYAHTKKSETTVSIPKKTDKNKKVLPESSADTKKNY